MNEVSCFANLGAGLVLLVLIGGCKPGGSASPSGATGESSGCDRAAAEAVAAIAAGNLVLKEYPPLPSPPGHGEYVQLLRERCGVKYQVINNVPQGVEETVFNQEVRCWNDVMMAEIKRKQGQDIFDQLHDEARKRWQTQASSQSKN